MLNSGEVVNNVLASIPQYIIGGGASFHPVPSGCQLTM